MNKLKKQVKATARESEFLQVDIRRAQKLACKHSRLAELLLRDLIADAVRLQLRLEAISDALEGSE